MQISLPKEELKQYIGKQLAIFFPDSNTPMRGGT